MKKMQLFLSGGRIKGANPATVLTDDTKEDGNGDEQIDKPGEGQTGEEAPVEKAEAGDGPDAEGKASEVAAKEVKPKGGRRAKK